MGANRPRLIPSGIKFKYIYLNWICRSIKNKSKGNWTFWRSASLVRRRREKNSLKHYRHKFHENSPFIKIPLESHVVLFLRPFYNLLNNPSARFLCVSLIKSNDSRKLYLFLLVTLSHRRHSFKWRLFHRKKDKQSTRRNGIFAKGN